MLEERDFPIARSGAGPRRASCLRWWLQRRPASGGPQLRAPGLHAPNPADFRAELSNGLVVYLAEDHEIPWFDATLMVSDGPFLEPANKIGLASLTERLMREGGTTSMTGEEIDERMDFLAGSVSATRLSDPHRHLDEGLAFGWTS